MTHRKGRRSTDTARRIRAADARALVLPWLCILAGFAQAEDARTQLSEPQPGVSSRTAPLSQTRLDVEDRLAREKTGSLRGGAAANGRRKPDDSLDWTYRPTVVVRRGTSQGSGTIIASIDREALVLTAAHVVRDDGPIIVELHRFNLGLERSSTLPGSWPRRLRGTLTASDAASDLSVIRIAAIRPLPYVARLSRDQEAPPPHSPATSIGIDLGSKLAGWDSRVMDALTFELNDSGEPRSFLISDNVPEHGRSGGGLFLASGELLGVCLGHAELYEGKRMGVFASRESIERLLKRHHLTGVIRRSDSRHTARRHAPAGGPHQQQKEADRQEPEDGESHGP